MTVCRFRVFRVVVYYDPLFVHFVFVRCVIVLLVLSDDFHR
jgi:hypothetical protein